MFVMRRYIIVRIKGCAMDWYSCICRKYT